MTRGKPALRYELLQIGRELEKPDEIYDCGSILAGALADLLGIEN